MLFKPLSLEDETWSKLLHKLDEISSRESVEHDICLIGSHARGDASSISDIDLVLFSEGDSNLKKTELFFINQNIASIFSVNINGMLQAESLDFYNISNPFEAKLVYGDGKVLNIFRKGLSRKMIDFDETKRIIGKTLSNRLRSALRDTIRDYGEGIRNMRGCLVKLKLYIKLHRDKTDPWLMIPYRYEPEDELEKLINRLYYSHNYEELSSKLAELDLMDLMGKAFKKQLKTMIDIVEKIKRGIEFSGKYIENYLSLFLIVEERVRSVLWEKLSGRWKIKELKQRVNHSKTKIVCRDDKVWWRVSIGKGRDLKLENLGKTLF